MWWHRGLCAREGSRNISGRRVVDNGRESSRCGGASNTVRSRQMVPLTLQTLYYVTHLGGDRGDIKAVYQVMAKATEVLDNQGDEFHTVEVENLKEETIDVIYSISDEGFESLRNHQGDSSRSHSANCKRANTAPGTMADEAATDKKASTEKKAAEG